MEILLEQIAPRRRARQVPSDLIHEVIDGKPLYRKGWQAVLGGKKTIEEIMASSTLQGAVVGHLLRKVFIRYDETNYFVLTNEPGIHLNRRHNYAGDILVFDKKVLPPSAIDVHFAKVPALLHLEVDIKVDVEEWGEMRYIAEKTKQLLAFGTQKIVWVFTQSRTYLVAEPNQPWQTFGWETPLDLGEGVKIDLDAWIKDSGIGV